MPKKSRNTVDLDSVEITEAQSSPACAADEPMEDPPADDKVDKPKVMTEERLKILAMGREKARQTRVQLGELKRKEKEMEKKALQERLDKVRLFEEAEAKRSEPRSEQSSPARDRRSLREPASTEQPTKEPKKRNKALCKPAADSDSSSSSDDDDEPGASAAAIRARYRAKYSAKYAERARGAAQVDLRDKVKRQTLAAGWASMYPGAPNPFAE
eukprot:jgi/Chrzof1/12340/Cz06g31040.t1